MYARAFARMLLLGMLVASCAHARAAVPVMTFTAESRTALVLPADGAGRVSYRLTNQSTKSHRLFMKPIPGIYPPSDDPDDCHPQFVLGPKQSCRLMLVVDAKALPSDGIHGGPVVCETDRVLKCYQPDPANQLDIRIDDAEVACGAANGLIASETPHCWIRVPIPAATVSLRCSAACNSRGLTLDRLANSARIARTVCAAFGLQASPRREWLGLMTAIGQIELFGRDSCVWDDQSGDDWDNPNNRDFATEGSHFCPCSLSTFDDDR